MSLQIVRDKPQVKAEPIELISTEKILTDNIAWCAYCDHSLFYLLEGGGIQCAVCGALSGTAHFEPMEKPI